jgi:hypothetical protein
MEDFVDYREKYIKYKSKYFQLRQEIEQEGGIPPIAVFRGVQGLGRMGKIAYKASTGKLDSEIQEINAILNKTVYIREGDILTVYDYNPRESSFANEGITLVYSNLNDLLKNSNQELNTSESPDTLNSSTSKKPVYNVSKFLKAVKNLISETEKLVAQEQDIALINVYKNRINDLNRLLEIHYLCKGATGVFNYTVEKCFTNNHLPPSANKNAREQTKANENYSLQPQPNQYQPNQYQPNQYQSNQYQSNQYQQKQLQYRLKYYKYKSKYYQLVEFVEQNGGMSLLKTMGKGLKAAASATSKAISSVASSASSTVAGIGKSDNTVQKILVAHPDIAGLISADRDAKPFMDALAALKTSTGAEIKKLQTKEKDIKTLESIINSKCKKSSKDTKFTNENCFTGTTAPGAATGAATTPATTSTESTTSSTPATL